MPLVFPAPPISLSTAHAFAAFFTFSYTDRFDIRITLRIGICYTLSLSTPHLHSIAQTAARSLPKQHNHLSHGEDIGEQWHCG